MLLKACLEENNLNLYIMAVDVSGVLFAKAISHEVVLGSLPSLIKAVVLKTTDVNTRVRKHSVDLINQLWNVSMQTGEAGKKDSISGMIAEVLVDP